MLRKRLEKHINNFLRAYLDDNEEFRELADADKLYIYSVLRKLLTLIYQVIRYPNVYPILLVQNYKSKQIIQKAFKEVEIIIPTVNNIKIEVVN
uniref:Uncharacterized protein n=1 Tax=uncultured Alphaproteobacteria bacterium TaxID=91750 RepID=A0A1B0Z1L5_9PROT|nr:hypothetical protein [uncultured Alphaproteobacteria bacterium]